jgi:hypothetical protein
MALTGAERGAPFGARPNFKKIGGAADITNVCDNFGNASPMSILWCEHHLVTSIDLDHGVARLGGVSSTL